MTQAIVDQLATAVAADLANPANAAAMNAAGPFDVERISVLEFDVEPLTRPKIFIFGADERRTILNRVKTEREWDVEIIVAAKLGADSNTTVDPLKALIEQIGDFWEASPVPTGTGRRWVSMEVVPYIPELIKQAKFVGGIKLTFKGAKS